MKRFCIILLYLFISLSGFAITWDEPWQRDIFEEADYLVLGKVIRATNSEVILQIEKSFGKELKGQIKIDDFFMLYLCSDTDERPHFFYKEGFEGYFFLKKGKNGNYQVPTPSAGFDRIVNGKVHATYRHTYNKAAITPDVYELTHKEIWNKFHNSPDFNKKNVEPFINEYLSIEPAALDSDELEIFYNQHVALETAYLIEMEINFATLKKFVESDNYHSQISALSAMGNLKTDEVKNYLLRYILDKDNDNFNKVIAIWSLWYMDDKEMQQRLWNIKDELSDIVIGFGGNSNDPRSCTHFPSPRQAVYELVDY